MVDWVTAVAMTCGAVMCWWGQSTRRGRAASGSALTPVFSSWDECHRCGSEINRIALAGEFESRLGLSATHARLDGTHETVIEPYFGGVVYRFGYADAIAQGVVARFSVVLVAVSFSEEERAQYEHLDEKVRRARARLIEAFGVPPEPFGEFMKAVNRLRCEGAKHEAIAAGQYLSPFNRRRELLAETEAKYEGLSKLEGAVRSARRVIIFTQTVHAAELATAELVDLGIDAQALHSALDMVERREVLARFARGHLHAIVAPQVLDEGVDVPDADLGIIVAASRQRRQMIQRMGRVLRPKNDGRLARFAVLYVQGTSEDLGHWGRTEPFSRRSSTQPTRCGIFQCGPPRARSATTSTSRFRHPSRHREFLGFYLPHVILGNGASEIVQIDFHETSLLVSVTKVYRCKTYAENTKLYFVQSIRETIHQIVHITRTYCGRACANYLIDR